MTSPNLPLPHRSLLRLGLLVTFLIVYGSLVPFEYRSATWDQALDQFTHIPWLKIGVGGRADWVANLVLYFPLGFLICGALSRRTLFGAMIATAIFGTLLAVGVEFLQIWAAPRTVSLNDIVAEIAGTLIGLVTWAIVGRRVTRTAQTVLTGGPQALRAAVVLYLLAYGFVTLFPFDFLVTSAELHARLDDPGAIVWLPRGVSSLRGLASLVLKAALMSPLGVVVRLVWQRGLAATLVAAFALSGLLEVVHWFEYSEQTDALSIVVAMAGAVTGYLLASSIALFGPSLAPWLRRGAFLATPAYLALLPMLRGWKLGHVDRGVVERTLASTHWLPFYYHYYSSEGHALASFVSISVSFVPLGALAWAMRLRAGTSAGVARSTLPVATVAFVLAVVLEAGGLITAGKRPDPTNVLIAVGIAMFTQRACEWLASVLEELPATARVAG